MQRYSAFEAVVVVVVVVVAAVCHGMELCLQPVRLAASARMTSELLGVRQRTPFLGRRIFSLVVLVAEAEAETLASVVASGPMC